ncbi:ankyrin repeat domain-containing protein [Qipengyuania sp.]|uniref:ankyrin repeat domain-containing protein n=1 Tax=Qipengyuania sp. TaxID=2004515 RepID=UPI0035C7D409
MIRRWLATMVLAGLASATVAPQAVLAQAKSERSEFLKSVRERDGNTATELLNRPGTVVVNTREFTTGETALHIVTERRDLTWLKWLLGKGASPDPRNKAGETPLQLAANLGWVDGVEALVGAGAAVDERNNLGETALIAAVHRRDLALVRSLLKAGADPERTDNSGRSAKTYADLMGPGPMKSVIDDTMSEQAARKAMTYGPGA